MFRAVTTTTRGQPLPRLRLASRVLALLLCGPLVGGAALGNVVDSIVYPHGACCCERAHGRPHHCHCVEMDNSGDGASDDATRCISARWGDSDDEYGAPALTELPTALVANPVEPVPAWHLAAGRVPAMSSLLSRRAAPPTPPPPIQTRSA
jgi:hypothetical protein